jgi:hypothetical protein
MRRFHPHQRLGVVPVFVDQLHSTVTRGSWQYHLHRSSEPSAFLVSRAPKARVGRGSISANLIVIARRLIVPEGLMKVARLRKAYVAIGAVGVANRWLRVRRSPRRRPGTKCLEWSKKKRSVPEGQDDFGGAAVDSITEPSTWRHDLCRPTREYIITPSLRDKEDRPRLSLTLTRLSARAVARDEPKARAACSYHGSGGASPYPEPWPTRSLARLPALARHGRNQAGFVGAAPKSSRAGVGHRCCQGSSNPAH